MGFVHDAEYDSRVGAVLLGKLSPDALELSISGAALRDDGIVPSSIVVLERQSIDRSPWTMIYIQDRR